MDVLEALEAFLNSGVMHIVYAVVGTLGTALSVIFGLLWREVTSQIRHLEQRIDTKNIHIGNLEREQESLHERYQERLEAATAETERVRERLEKELAQVRSEKDLLRDRIDNLWERLHRRVGNGGHHNGD